VPFSVKGLRKEGGEAGEHNTPRPARKIVHSPSKLRDETIGHSIIEQMYDIPRARPLPREFGSLCTFDDCARREIPDDSIRRWTKDHAPRYEYAERDALLT